MGAEQSTEVRELSPEQISHEITEKFALKSYSQLELYCFKQVFKNLADDESGIEYWSEGSLCRFLELPDALNAGPVLYQMTTFLGAFPFPSQAPCIVTREALLKVVTLMTERYNKVLKRGKNDRLRLFYSSLAVFDRRASHVLEAEAKAKQKEKLAEDPLAETIKSMEGFAVDEALDDDYEEGEDDEDDDLALALLDTLDATEVIGLGEAPRIRRSIIPTDNFLKLIELLLLVSPLQAQQSLSEFAEHISDDRIGELRSVAANILATFGVQGAPGITYRTFRAIVQTSLPHMFDGLSPLFEHFLFERTFDLSKRRPSDEIDASDVSPEPAAPAEPTSPKSPMSPTSLKSPVSPSSPRSPSEFPLLSPTIGEAPLFPTSGDILNFATLSQLSFILPPSSLFHRLHPLYSGAEEGFSMGSFESSVFSWRGPSLMLVSGTLLPETASNSRERSFADTLPPRRFESGGESAGKQVTYGAYVPVQWKTTHREPFGNADMLLFQLTPAHDVFRASSVSTDYATFRPAVPTTKHAGIGFGSPLPLPGQGNAPLSLGPVSLYLDAALEFAVFTHTAASGEAGSGRSRAYSQAMSRRFSDANMATGTSSGGSFRPSSAPSRSKQSWQHRFQIETLEVYGIGGQDVEERRRRDLAFEEREARWRREGRSSVGGAGHEADRELLKMAGLIGHGESGGSMG